MHDVMLNLKLDTRVGLQMGKISKSAQSDQTSTVMEAQRNLLVRSQWSVIRTFLFLTIESLRPSFQVRPHDRRRPSSIVTVISHCGLKLSAGVC